MEAKFSQRVKDVLSFSREEAVRLGNDYIGVEHLILGIIREGEGLLYACLDILMLILLTFARPLKMQLQTIPNVIGRRKIFRWLSKQSER